MNWGKCIFDILVIKTNLQTRKSNDLATITQGQFYPIMDYFLLKPNLVGSIQLYFATTFGPRI